MTLLKLASVKRQFGHVKAIDGVSLDVQRGSRTAIVGPSGCGKTTLLRLIAGFETVDEGVIEFAGTRLAAAGMHVPAHKRGIGIVSQDGSLFPHLTIAQNIGFGLKARPAEKKERIDALMDMVELDRSMLSRRPDQLSGGQQQRVALARAMAHEPRLILLDEPFSALDTALRAATRKAVGEVLGRAGITTLLVTHDQAEALAFADQIVVMRGGRFVQVGTPRDVYQRPVDPLTAAFLGEAIVLPADIAEGVASTAIGKISVEGTAGNGRAEILLRPEQMVVSPLSQDMSADDDTVNAGTVAEVEFAGATCELSVCLDRAPDCRIQLTIPTRFPFERGSRVCVRATGPAHVFPK